MTEYANREVDVHVLPLGRVTLLHPERCVLQFGKGGPTIDVGALCYRQRSTEVRSGKQKSRGVVLASLDKARIDITRKLISHLSIVAKSGGKEMISIHRDATAYFNFVDWCDEAGHKGPFGTEQDGRHAFRAYVEHLRHRVNTDDLSVNSAIVYQNPCAVILNGLFDVDDMTRGVRLLQSSFKAINIVSPPDEITMRKVLSLCQMVFDGVATHVLDSNPYPFKLEMPGYLEWKENYLWIFPAVRAFIAPHELARRTELGNANWPMDYQNGRLASKEEVAQLYSLKRKAARGLSAASMSIIDANNDAQHYRRRELAMLAHNAFVQLFLANTGMNWAVLRKLPWDDDHVVDVDGQGFRAIKFRARGKLVSFRIEIVFLPMFKRYLELRRYLLNGTKCRALFFTFGPHFAGQPKPMGAIVLANLSRSLRRIDPSLPRVLARQMRANKSDWLIRNTDLSTTAHILQNTERTTTKSYINGSESRAIEEMGLFYEKLSQVILDPGKVVTASMSSALGECTAYGSPKPTDEAPPITPDCHQPEGCLFCDKYIVHADERDTRKLLSCRYCFYHTAHFSASEEHFQSLFGEVLKRIDAILREIGKRSDENAKMVERVRAEVEDEGNLDNYWGLKMQMLRSLGVVAQ